MVSGKGWGWGNPSCRYGVCNPLSHFSFVRWKIHITLSVILTWSLEHVDGSFNIWFVCAVLAIAQVRHKDVRTLWHWKLKVLTNIVPEQHYFCQYLRRAGWQKLAAFHRPQKNPIKAFVERAFANLRNKNVVFENFRDKNDIFEISAKAWSLFYWNLYERSLKRA